MRYLYFSILSLSALFLTQIGYADNPFNVRASYYAGGDDHSNIDDNARCKAVKSLPIPHESLPKKLKNCNPKDYFYGMNGHTIDYKKARICALNTPNVPARIINSYQILQMIYANGYGTKQNLDLATKFACENGEQDDQIAALAPENYKKNDGDFNVCDYSKDPNFKTICLNEIPQQVDDNKRNLKMQAVVGKWPQTDQIAFKKLQKANGNYVDAYINGELDVRFYADRRMFDTTDMLNQEFFNKFMKTKNGDFPSYTDAQFEKLDQQLNQLYKKIMAKGEDTYYTGITHDSLRKVQRAWLKYRDAWATFAQTRNPKISANSIKAWLTEARIADLKEDFNIKENI